MTPITSRAVESVAAAPSLGPTRLAYVAKDGTPRTVPIGFTWNGSQIVLCTAKNAPKLAASETRRSP